MTENSAFFGARRGVGPPDAGPQTAAVRRACQRRQIEPDWHGNGGYLGNTRGEGHDDAAFNSIFCGLGLGFGCTRARLGPEHDHRSKP